MQENIETFEHEITHYLLTEDEDIFIEKNDEGLFLCDFEVLINLGLPYTVENFKIVQGDDYIELPDQIVLDYFNKLIKENIK